MIESHFRWFGHALKRPKESIRRIDEVEGSLIDRGRVPMKTIEQRISKEGRLGEG